MVYCMVARSISRSTDGTPVINQFGDNFHRPLFTASWLTAVVSFTQDAPPNGQIRTSLITFARAGRCISRRDVTSLSLRLRLRLRLWPASCRSAFLDAFMQLFFSLGLLVDWTQLQLNVRTPVRPSLTGSIPIKSVSKTVSRSSFRSTLTHVRGQCHSKLWKWESPQST